MISNKRLGSKFEGEFAEFMYKQGFWVHLLRQSEAGQPADIIAVKNGQAVLIDCKVCSGDAFPLERIEPNQTMAMAKWQMCGNGEGWFALKTSEGVYMVSLNHFANAEKRRFNLEDIRVYGSPADKWVKRWN